MKESDIQRQILDYLALKRIFHYRNNSGGLAGEHKGKRWFVRFGALRQPGHHLRDRGPVCRDRSQRPKGVQSANQKEFQAKLEAAGGKYILAYSLDDIFATI